VEINTHIERKVALNRKYFRLLAFPLEGSCTVYNFQTCVIKKSAETLGKPYGTSDWGSLE
jgi:hypothetical protein